MKTVQIIWWREWHFHFGFIKGDPLKKPAAFHLIYKWGLWLGFMEIRKFLTDKDREIALAQYIRNK